MSQAAADPDLQTEIQAKLARLRQLQTEEADEMEKRFDAGLLLKPGEGWQALEERGSSWPVMKILPLQTFLPSRRVERRHIHG